MQKQNLWGGSLWLLLGVVLCVSSNSIGLGSFRTPATGFFPFLIGAFMALFGLVLLVTGGGKKIRIGRDPGKDVTVPTAERTLRLHDLIVPAATLTILVAYVVLLEWLGFLLTTFLCLLGLFKLSYRDRWLMPLFFSGTAVTVSYLVFVLWLRNPFPIGIFGF